MSDGPAGEARDDRAVFEAWFAATVLQLPLGDAKRWRLSSPYSERGWESHVNDGPYNNQDANLFLACWRAARAGAAKGDARHLELDAVARAAVRHTAGVLDGRGYEAKAIQQEDAIVAEVLRRFAALAPRAASTPSVTRNLGDCGQCLGRGFYHERPDWLCVGCGSSGKRPPCKACDSTGYMADDSKCATCGDYEPPWPGQRPKRGAIRGGVTGSTAGLGPASEGSIPSPEATPSAAPPTPPARDEKLPLVSEYEMNVDTSETPEEYLARIRGLDDDDGEDSATPDGARDARDDIDDNDEPGANCPACIDCGYDPVCKHPKHTRRAPDGAKHAGDAPRSDEAKS